MCPLIFFDNDKLLILIDCNFILVKVMCLVMAGHIGVGMRILTLSSILLLIGSYFILYYLI